MILLFNLFIYNKTIQRVSLGLRLIFRTSYRVSSDQPKQDFAASAGSEASAEA